jgi:hypothetical protein
MTTKTYNGWTNYETWVVSLWMDNDEGSCDYWRDRAREILAEAKRVPSDTFTPAEDATISLSDEIKEQHEEAQPEVTGVFADLINAAMSEVNWYEIAEHYVSEVAEEEEGTKGKP